MNKTYKLDNGWKVEKNKDDIPILHVTPISNSVFKKYQNVEITEEIFDDITKGERDLKKLFKKYKLHKIIMEDSMVEVRPEVVFTNTPTKYHGRGFIVTQEGDNFF